MSDAELVTSIYVNTISAERGFWRDDIIKKIIELDPEIKTSKENNSTRLINILVKIAQNKPH